MKISGYFQAIILASTILLLLAIPSSSYRKMETKVGDVEVIDPHFEKKAVQLGSVSVEDQNLIVLMHESYRAQVESTNMMKMRYHAGIAHKAQGLADTCVFAHDTAKNRSVADVLPISKNLYGPTPLYLAELPGVYVGQNLCMGHSSWAACINSWADEKNNFAYGIGSTNGGAIGHYTQIMLWKTTAIGCGFNTCEGSRLYVCNYAYGQYTNDMRAPWKSGKQCADCPNTCTIDGFCDCGGSFCNSTYKIMAPTCVCMNWWTI